MTRPPASELTWHDKPLAELDRDELIELIGALHAMVWASSENVERVMAVNHELMQRQPVGHA